MAKSLSSERRRRPSVPSAELAHVQEAALRVLRPVNAAGAALRARSAVAWALMLFGSRPGRRAGGARGRSPTNGRTSGPRPTRAMPAQARGRRPRTPIRSCATAIKAREVKTASLKPAEFKVDVVLTGGAKHTVGYSPTDQMLVDRLAASGAQVEVDTSFARKRFPWRRWCCSSASSGSSG